MTDASFLGIDVGTSGVRAALVDASGNLAHLGRAPLPPSRRDGAGHAFQDAPDWWRALVAAVTTLPEPARRRVTAIGLDATSGTVLAVDERGEPLGPARMYDDRAATAAAERIAHAAPPESGAHGAGSGLAKALELLQAHPRARILTQADWLLERLGASGVSDENNALKLGYDPVARYWPEWLRTLAPNLPLPEVLPPGAPAGRLSPEAARTLGLPAGALLAAATTDSVAATLAAGIEGLGEGVTALGTTLALKLAGTRPVFDPARGIYSHRLGEVWLAAGASNSGGAVLARFFTPERLRALSEHIDPDQDSGLDYYPLPAPGERFPVADSQCPPRLEPRPADDVRFLHGLLEGIARIEAEGYRLLAERAGTRLRRVWTTGGGASNPTWTALRRRLLQVPVAPAAQQEAAVGAARLARCAVTGEPPLTLQPTEANP